MDSDVTNNEDNPASILQTQRKSLLQETLMSQMKLKYQAMTHS